VCASAGGALCFRASLLKERRFDGGRPRGRASGPCESDRASAEGEEARLQPLRPAPNLQLARRLLVN
jgi:hypothetical protein